MKPLDNQGKRIAGVVETQYRKEKDMIILFILIAANAICIISALVWQGRKASESNTPAERQYRRWRGKAPTYMHVTLRIG